MTNTIVFIVAAALNVLVSACVAWGAARRAKDGGREPGAAGLAAWGVYVAAAVLCGAVLFGLGWGYDYWRHGAGPDAGRIFGLLAVLTVPMIAAGLGAVKCLAGRGAAARTAGAAEDSKTLGFFAVAGAMILVAWAAVPWTPAAAVTDLRGKPLVEEFDPKDIFTLEIVEIDENTNVAKEPFVIAKKIVGGKPRFTIPSHEDYRADAAQHLADAATGLLGREILDVAAATPESHEELGVLDPKDAPVGAKGVGKRVVMKDEAGEDLLALIVSKVKVPDQPTLHYVRRVGEDPVYVAAVDVAKLSTRFEDWIERDLLKFNPLHVKRLEIHDYSVDAGRRAIEPRGEITVEYNDASEPRWKLLKDDRFDGERGRWVPAGLGPDEELNATALGDLKSALGNLKIVDVSRKPKGLSSQLKADEAFLKDKKAVISLANHGFHAVMRGDRPDLLSNEGEFTCVMQDGVEYVLRFGALTVGAGSGARVDGKKGSDSLVNRYLLVMAQFNPANVEKPQLESVPPEEPADAASTKPRPPVASQDKPDDAKAAAKSDAKPAEKKPDDAKADAKSDAKDAEKKPDDAKAAAKARRDKIIEENQRKQDRYQEEVEKGQKRADELNARFADWYYVIADDVYKKIHLGRKDIVQKKKPDAKTDPKTPGHGPDDGHDHGPGAKTPAADPLQEFDDLKRSGP